MSCLTPSPRVLLVIFTAINLLNYMDRGIVTGSSLEFETFIAESLGVGVTTESAYLGALNSVYICVYAIACIVAGHLASRMPPMKVVAWGLVIWVLAVVASGMAKSFNSFYVLAVGRAFSGCGEASFQCVGPPFIEKYAPESSKSLWMGLFYVAIPLGTAIGFGFSAIMSQHLGWDWAYYIEAVMMVPFIVFCFLVKLPKAPELPDNSYADELSREPSLKEEFTACVSNSVFVCITLGYAAFNATIAGFSTFGPTFALGLGLLDDEVTASLYFGGVVALAGILGTPLGGIIADRAVVGVLNIDAKIRITVFYLVGMMVIGVGFCAGAALANNLYAFFGLLFIGLFFSFGTTALLTLVILWSVPLSIGPFAVALCNFSIHAFGDVPAPIMFGALKDSLAPNCNSVIDNTTHQSILNPDCKQDRRGLHIVELVAVGWLIWSLVLWSVAWFVASHRSRSVQLQLENRYSQKSVSDGYKQLVDPVQDETDSSARQQHQ